jgi:hypothetical protein
MGDLLEDLEVNEKVLLASLIKALRNVRFGHILITVHDSNVVQIEKTEKIRPDKANAWHYDI